MMSRRRCRRWFLLLSALSLLILASGQELDERQQHAAEASSKTAVSDNDDVTTVDDNVEQPPPNQEANDSTVQVEDYLLSLSNNELEQICRDRGFEIAPRPDGQDLTREDYLEGARRCLTLEDEMNAILAENPELAAELDAEIARMKESKERLERERDEILAQKQLLEEQLKNAGVDVGSAPSNQTTALRARGGGDGAPLTLVEVLRESFTMLFHRVNQDVQLVRKVLSPVLTPVGQGLRLVWRYSRPALEGMWKRLRTILEEKQLLKKQESDDNVDDERRVDASKQEED